MPELPEVEIARENLERWLGNRVIESARVRDRRILRGQSVRRVERVLGGVRLQGIRRQGKYLMWDLGGRSSKQEEGNHETRRASSVDPRRQPTVA